MAYNICKVLGLFLVKVYKQNQIAQLSVINKSQKYKKKKLQLFLYSNNCFVTERKEKKKKAI